jgi:hypothetical protein
MKDDKNSSCWHLPTAGVFITNYWGGHFHHQGFIQ